MPIVASFVQEFIGMSLLTSQELVSVQHKSLNSASVSIRIIAFGIILSSRPGLELPLTMRLLGSAEVYIQQVLILFKLIPKGLHRLILTMPFGPNCRDNGDKFLGLL